MPAIAITSAQHFKAFAEFIDHQDEALSDFLAASGLPGNCLDIESYKLPTSLVRHAVSDLSEALKLPELGWCVGEKIGFQGLFYGIDEREALSEKNLKKVLKACP